MPNVNEWTLTADIAKWIEEILRGRVDLPFSKAEVEERGKGTRKRRDLTIYNRTGQRVLTGELKMPDSPEGGSPFRDSLVIDAHEKADNVGVEYFFTCNVNRCVLWKTFEQGKPITERHIEHFYVIPSPVRRSDEIEHPRVQDQIKQEQSLRDAPGSTLSGRSDIHCYFFTHGFSFLQEGGYMGLLTSSLWTTKRTALQLQPL